GPTLGRVGREAGGSSQKDPGKRRFARSGILPRTRPETVGPQSARGKTAVLAQQDAVAGRPRPPQGFSLTMAESQGMLCRSKWPGWTVLVPSLLFFAVRDPAFFPSLSSAPDWRVVLDHFVETPIFLSVWVTLAFGAGSNFLRHVFRLLDLPVLEEFLLAVP